MDNEGCKNLEKQLKSDALHTKLVIWGASDKSKKVLEWLISKQISVYGFIDRDYINIKEYKGYLVYGPEKLAEEKFFVYVALQADYEDVIKWLHKLNYKEFTDYWYPRRVIKLDGMTNYQDLYGNCLVSENCNPIQVKLRDGGKVQIMSKRLDSSTEIASEGRSVIKIGRGIQVKRNTVFSATNGNIEIGEKCKFDEDVLLRVSCGGKILLGDYCSVQRQCIFVASFDAKILLGKDCMISYSVYLRAGNSHNMIDLNTGEHLDSKSNRDVVLGEHVWCGMRATIMNGVKIGSGSTVGANSFVCKKEFGQNCCLAGNPVHVIRKKTAWMRDGVRMHEDVEDYRDYIYCDQD